MPTGYTSDLYEGKSSSARDFLLKCATAFDYASSREGASLEPSDPDTDYYDGEIAKHEKRIAEIAAWNREEAENQAELAFQAEVQRVHDQRARYAGIRQRYEATLAEVEAWEPPTDTHGGLHKFAIEQLRNSLDFDCSTDWLKDPERKSGAAYKAALLYEETRALGYDREARAKAIQCNDERNEWIEALLGSLPAEPSA